MARIASGGRKDSLKFYNGQLGGLYTRRPASPRVNHVFHDYQSSRFRPNVIAEHKQILRP
jgi:hypothetical protein